MSGTTPAAAAARGDGAGKDEGTPRRSASLADWFRALRRARTQVREMHQASLVLGGAFPLVVELGDDRAP